MKSCAINFLLTLVSSSLLLLAVLYLVEHRALTIEQNNQQAAMEANLQAGLANLRRNLDFYTASLRATAESQIIKRLPNQPEIDTPQQAKERFLDLLKSQPDLDQIRWIDQQGRERLRAQMTDQGPILVPPDKLQNKSQRPYVITGLSLNNDDVFISGLNLNQEFGRVALPHKPMIRLLTPIQDETGNRNGMLVMNIRADGVLHHLVDATQETRGELMVINTVGEWLHHPDAKLEWGVGLGHGELFPNHFPQAWATISAQSKGNVLTPEGWFFFTTLPLSDNRLTMLMRVSQKNLNLHLWRDHHDKILVLLAASVIISAVSTLLRRRICQLEIQRDDQRKLFRNIFRSNPEPTLMVDSDGFIQKANTSATILFEYEDGDLIGQSVKILIPDYPRESSQIPTSTHTSDAISQLISESKHLTGMTRTGISIPVEVLLSSLMTPEGPMMLATIRDLRPHKEAEKVIQEARKAAESANAAKSEFLANMSHEIRTPLNAVIGFTELLNRANTDPTQKHYLEGISTSSRNLLQLINDILDLSKIEAGHMRLESEPTDFFLICEEIRHICTPLAAQREVLISLDFSPDLPHQLVLDETRTRQILLNLVSNAVKYTMEGFVRIHAYGYNDEDSGTYKLIVEITDTGVGIPETQRKAIFDAFIQVPGQQKSALGSTGLGLAITRRLVALMGGQISLTSTEGKGSQFIVQIPTTPCHEEMIQEPSTERRLTKVRFHPAVVLLVEDVDLNREVVKGMLQGQPLEILEAENGEQGLLLCTERRPDLVLIDMRMPIMDGYEATRHIKNNPELRDIPVVALTASGLEETNQQSLDICDGYLRKPISLAQLIDTLKRFLPHDYAPETQENMPVAATVSPAPLQPLPPSVAEAFSARFATTPRDLRTLRSMSRLGKLAEELKSFGTEHQLIYLNEFGDELSVAVAGNRISAIKTLLGKYENIVNQMLNCYP